MDIMSCLCCDEYIQLGCHNYCNTIEFAHVGDDGDIKGSAENRGNVWQITGNIEGGMLTLDLTQLREYGLHKLKFGSICYEITTGNY